MEQAYFYLAVAGMLTVLMWVPYILARLFVWGPLVFLNNYPEGFPAREPEAPMWAQRAKRAHLNMVETVPAFVAVVAACGFMADRVDGGVVGYWAGIFVLARVIHYLVYALGVPFLRTPVYLVSWAAVLLIGIQLV